MADPTKFSPVFSYSNFEASNPTSPKPGQYLDGDAYNIALSISETIDALKNVRRSDGKLNNKIVTKDSLAPDALALINANGTPRGAWAAATKYNLRDLIDHADEDNSATYIAVAAHVSGDDFAADLAAGKWMLFASPVSEATSELQARMTDAESDITQLSGVADANLFGRSVERIANSPDDAPTVGMRRLIGTEPMGAWAGKQNRVAEYFADGWHYSGAPQNGQELKIGLITYRFATTWGLAPCVVSDADYGGDAPAAALAIGRGDRLAGPSIINSPYYPEFEGARGNDDSFDSTAAINAAIVYAADQRRILKLNRAYYCNAGDSGVKLQSYVMLEGSGYKSGISAMDDCDAGDLIAYYDPANVVGTQGFNLKIDGRKRIGGVANANMPNIVNGLNNTAADGPATSGHPGHRWDSIYITNLTGRGQTIGFAQRSSFFTNFVIYFCDSYGLRDSSNDCFVGNYDIGQCWADDNANSNPAGWYVSGVGGQRANFKIWGIGQYGGTLAVPGVFVRNGANFHFNNVWTQECGGPGLSVFGSGQTVPGLIFTNFSSDGDCVAATAAAAITLNNTEGLQLIGRAGKWEDNLAGNPTAGLNITSTVTGSHISLQTKGLTGKPVVINSAAVGNDISVNGHRSKSFDHTYGANFTPEVFDARCHTMTLTGATLVNAPTVLPDGELISFAFLNAAGAAAPTWNAAFLPPPDWATDFVTTAGKRNIVTFRRSAAAGKWVCHSAIYGV